MTNNNRKSILLTGFIIVLLVNGCVHRTADPAHPGVTSPVTRYEQVLAWNVALSQANNSIAQGVIEANKGPVQWLGDMDARQILSVQFQIASWDKEVTVLLQEKDRDPAGWTDAKAQRLDELLGQIRLSAKSLVDRQSLGITDPNRAAAVKASIDTVYFMSDLVVRGLIETGTLKGGQQ